MSVSVRRHATSGNYHIPAPGSEFTARDIYTVTWTGDPAAAPDDGDIILDAIAAGLPAIQSRHPSCDQNLGMLVCQGHDWQKLPGCSTAWNVTVTWGTYANFLNLSGEGADTEPFTRVTRVGSIRMSNAYRIDLTPPANASYSWPPTTDIGGTKVDINGVPTPIAIVQIQIQVEFLYDRTTVTSDSGGEPDSDLMNFINTRNDAPFLGFDEGYLLCTAINVSPLNDQWYMVQATLVYDEWRHYEQKCAPNVGGINFLQSSGTFIGVPMKRATKVGWFTPHIYESDFEKLFPEDVYPAIASIAPTGAPYAGCATAGRDFTNSQFDYAAFPP